MGENPFLKKEELEEVKRHAKIYGYPPNLASQRYYYGKLVLLKRQQLKSQSRSINDKIDEVNAKLRDLHKNRVQNKKRSVEQFSNLMHRKKMALQKQQSKIINNEQNDLPIEGDRRKHLYRGMDKQDYHSYYDSVYNFILDQEFICHSDGHDHDHGHKHSHEKKNSGNAADNDEESVT